MLSQQRSRDLRWALGVTSLTYGGMKHVSHVRSYKSDVDMVETCRNQSIDVDMLERRVTCALIDRCVRQSGHKMFCFFL